MASIEYSIALTLFVMSKKIKNHSADIKNPNKGTSGTNKTYDKAQGNRGKQMKSNQKPTKKG